MHGSRQVVRDLYYGADGGNLYVRVDFDATPELQAIELRTAQGAKVPLLGNAGVETAQKKIFEARVPLRLLGVSNDNSVQFQIALATGNAPPETIPPDGWIEFPATSG
jgi:hypothetical protein